MIVVFQVTEQRLIKSVTFRGNRAISNETLKGAIDIKDGQANRYLPHRAGPGTRLRINIGIRIFRWPMSPCRAEPLAQRGELIFDIVEGPQVRVRNIEFIGVNSFTQGRLREQIKTATYLFILNAGKYDPEGVDDDVASVRRFYEGKGFFDVRVDRKLVLFAGQYRSWKSTS